MHREDAIVLLPTRRQEHMNGPTTSISSYRKPGALVQVGWQFVGIEYYRMKHANYL